MSKSLKSAGTFKRHGFVWVTLGFFIVSLILHWYFGWETFKAEQITHGEEIKVSEYANEMLRDTLENWQSEFLQLIWQVAGLALLFHIGSPQSKEGDDRKEEKLDYIIKQLNPEDGEKIIKQLDQKYPKK